jgi:hypothetical protein
LHSFPHLAKKFVPVRGIFRNDLELMPGAGFRLRRRTSARVFSGLLAVAAVGWGAYDIAARLSWVGAATLLLAIAFVVQLVQAELNVWRFDGDALRSGRFQVDAREIRRVRLAQSEDGRSRAWVETRGGEQLPLVEGDEEEVRRIADRLSRALLLVSPRPPEQWLN